MKRNLHLKTVLFLFFSISISNNLFSQKFVKASGIPGTGASWDSPLIGAAGLRLACQGGGIVYVAAGTYTITTSVTLMQLSQASHTIQGGFPANATGTSIANYNPTTNATIIDGNNNQIFAVENIVSSSITVNIKGFSLINAVDNSGSNLASVFISDNSLANGPTLANYSFTDLTITNNRYAFDINGLSNAASKVLFKNCYFSNNVSINAADCIDISDFGASSSAASSFIIDSCTFVGNHASSFAEVHIKSSYGVTFRKNNFCNNNTVSLGGSGICEENCTNMLISTTNFRNNGTATNNYGAICMLGSSSTVTIDNCMFYGNYINGNNTTSQNSDIKALNTACILTNCGVQGPVSYYTGFATKTNNVYSSATDPGSCTTAIILPITGLVLTGQLVNSLPQLKWATLTEQNANYFDIQSSANGNSFISIGKVAAAGTSNALLNYSFTDNSIITPIVYYRLAIVDKDGKINYSNTVAIKTSGPMASSFNIFPNPATNYVNIETGEAGTYQLELFNSAGQRIQFNQLSSTASGSIILNINRSSIVTGMYVLKVTDANGSFWHRTILLK